MCEFRNIILGDWRFGFGCYWPIEYAGISEEETYTSVNV
jgi:hypothetical protein